MIRKPQNGNLPLEDVILVGDSYAAPVITGVVDQVPQHVGHLVTLDTFVRVSSL